MRLKFILLFCCLLLVSGCRDTDPAETVQTGPGDTEKVQPQLKLKGCRACHPDIDHDALHDFPCFECHHGNRDAAVLEEAHSGLIAQPAHPDFMAEVCGKCHPDQVQESRDSLHFTLRNEVNLVRKHFGAAETLRSLTGIPLSSSPTIRMELVDDMLRRRCLRCHVYSAGDDYPSTRRGTGCAACHMKFADGKPAGHELTAVPGDSQCLSCHYGNFVGADYYGRFEHDFNEEYRTPYTTKQDFIRPYGVEYHELVPDIHQQRGLACVDCHSGHQLMSEGETKKLRCATCHLWEKESNAPLPDNLVVEEGRLVLTAKLSGKKYPMPQAGDPVHEKYVGEIECQVCHAQWSFSDETTHLIRSDADDYDAWERLIVQSSSEVENFLRNNLSFDREEREPVMKDSISGREFPGVWYKGYTQRRWEKITIRRDWDGIIKVFRPILDLRVSYIDSNEDVIFDSEAGFGPAMIPYTPHTTGPAGLFYRNRFADLIDKTTKPSLRP